MNRQRLGPLLLMFLLCFAPASFATALADPPAAAEVGTQGAADPLVGEWECSNGVFTYTIYFRADGTLIQQEPTFGNSRNASWTRLSEQDIAVAGGPVLTVTRQDDERMSVVNNQVGATWDCSRRE